jgi:MFS family permease
MDDPAVLSLRTVSVKQALDQIGYGRYHTFLLIMCCCFRAAEAMWVVGVTYLAEFLVDSTWNISVLQKACLVASINAGSFLGGPVWGIISDNYGRTKAYLASAILAVIFGVICGASVNFLMLAIIEFCAGFVMCGFTVANTLLAEFLPVEHRGRAIVTLQSSKMYAFVSEIQLAYYILRV